MRKILFFILLLIPIQANAMQQLWLGGVGGTGQSNSATNFVLPMNYDAAPGATETSQENLITYAGVVNNMFIKNGTAAPGAGTSYTMTVRKNGADTAITCQISGASATTCSDTTHSINVLPGDLIDIKTVPVGTPSGSISFRTSLTFNSTDSPNKSCYSSSSVGNTLATGATNYMPVTGGIAPTATEANTFIVVPISGYIESLSAVLGTAPGSGKSYTFTLRKNSTNTAMAFTISGTSTTGSTPPIRIAVSAGDKIDISSVPASTPSASKVALGFVFSSNTDRKFLYLANSFATASSASAKNYNAFTGVASVFTATSTNRTTYFNGTSIKITDMYVYEQTAPDNGGGTQSYTISLFDSIAGVDTVVTCPISEASTSCVYSGAFSPDITNAQRYNIEVSPTNTPATSLFSFALAGTMTYTSPAIVKQTVLRQATIKGFSQ